MSLDTYIARPDGAVNFLLMDTSRLKAEFFATVDTAGTGRTTTVPPAWIR
jgi:hypothetical protein